MQKALLLLVPLIAFGDTTPSKQNPNSSSDKDATASFYPRYPQDYTFKERIKIDRLSNQLRLHHRTLMMTKSCTPKNRRARSYYKTKYEELRKLEPTMTKYLQFKRYAR